VILMAAAAGLTAVWFLFRRKVLALPARNGASWETLLKRMRYRGGRKQRSASRKVLRALKKTHPTVAHTNYGEYEVTL
jgi:hypothetical protein